jgi:hypothetical protein
VCRETRFITCPTKECTLDVQAPRKASTEAPNLSKDEICFNFSLSISIWVSTTIGSQFLSVSDPEQSGSLGRTPVRWVWAEEVAWHHSSVEVVGSQTGEFPDPPPQHATQGGDFGGLTWRSQEPRGELLQGSNRSNSCMRFGATSTTIQRLARGVGSEGTTCPRTQGELRSTLGFTAPPEGQAPEASRVHYASPCT